MKKIAIFFVFFHLQLFPINRVVIVIHGTWAQKELWYLPGGDFFEALQKSVKKNDTAIVPFLWSGGLSHEDRFHGARVLAQLIKSYPLEAECVIIAHSHGANVALLAAQILGEDSHNKHSIALFFALGAPVSNRICVPNMKVIKYLYNLFSFDDLVQPIFGMARREFDEHQRIANICVVVNGKRPHHSGLHDPLIAESILSLHGLFKNACFGTPGILYFSKDNRPRYEVDLKRDIAIEEDLHAHRIAEAADRVYEFGVKLDQECHLQNDTYHSLRKTLPIQLLR